MSDLLNAVKGKALTVAEFFTPVLKVSFKTEIEKQMLKDNLLFLFTMIKGIEI